MANGKWVSVAAGISSAVLLSACSSADSKPVAVAPAGAMQSFDDEIARVKAALPNGLTCQKTGPDPSGYGTEEDYWCQSPGESLAFRVQYINAPQMKVVRVLGDLYEGRPDPDEARQDLRNLLAAYGYADLDKCIADGESLMTEPTYSVRCSTHGRTGTIAEFTIAPTGYK